VPGSRLSVLPEWLIKEGDATVVMLAVGDRAERRVVTTGLTSDQGLEITSGLVPGDLVITQGHIGVEHNTTITAAMRPQGH